MGWNRSEIFLADASIIFPASRFTIQTSVQNGRQKIMKKTFAFILSAGLIAAIGTISISCAPTAPQTTYDNRLLTAPSTLSLTATDSLNTAGIALACGCSFEPLVITGYGGDTSGIRFSFTEPLTADTNEHTLQAEIYPTVSKNKVPDSAWIAVEYNDSSTPFGTMLYDTIRVYASY
jgi:hypothetical protein